MPQNFGALAFSHSLGGERSFQPLPCVFAFQPRRLAKVPLSLVLALALPSLAFGIALAIYANRFRREDQSNKDDVVFAAFAAKRVYLWAVLLGVFYVLTVYLTVDGLIMGTLWRDHIWFRGIGLMLVGPFLLRDLTLAIINIWFGGGVALFLRKGKLVYISGGVYERDISSISEIRLAKNTLFSRNQLAIDTLDGRTKYIPLTYLDKNKEQLVAELRRFALQAS